MLKQAIAVVLLCVGLVGCAPGMASDRHIAPSGQAWETLSVMTESGYQIITCPINAGRVVVGKCFASSGNSVVSNMLTALSGTVLPMVGVLNANGHVFNVGSYAASVAQADAGVNVKVKK